MRIAPEYKLLWNIFLAHRWKVLGLLFFDILGGLFALLIPYLSKLQIEQLEKPSSTFFGLDVHTPILVLSIIIGAVFLVHILENVFQTIRGFLWNKADFVLSWGVEQILYQRLLAFDHAFLKNSRNQRIVQSIFDVLRVMRELLNFLSSTIRNCIVIFGIIPIFFSLNIWIALIVLLTVVFESFVLRLQVRRENMVRMKNDRLDDRFWRLRYLLRAKLPEIVTLSGEDALLSRYEALRDEMYHLAQKDTKLREVFGGIRSTLSSLSESVTTLIVGARVLSGAVSIGVFTMTLMYVSQLKSSLRGLMSISEDVMRLQLTLKRLGFFLSLKPRYKEGHFLDAPVARSGNLQASGLYYSYPNLHEEEQAYIRALLSVSKKQETKGRVYSWEQKEFQEWKQVLESNTSEPKEVLHGVDMDCAWGEITALVGRNGSGKTTLTQLLLRNMDPDQGSVIWAGRDLVTISPKHMREHVAIIQQEPFLLDDWSIRENLILGTTQEFSDDDLMHVLEQIGVADVVRTSPKGLESSIGEDIRFSGGQAQLLAIARVLLQNKPIIIFDEGTNQLDAEHEYKIMEVLKSIKKDHLIIMITHRMTSARRADKIYVLDEGRVIQKGTHAELLDATEGLYASFWQKQVVD